MRRHGNDSIVAGSVLVLPVWAIWLVCRQM